MAFRFVLVSNSPLLTVPGAEAALVQSHSGPVHLLEGTEAWPSWDEDSDDHRLEFVCLRVQMRGQAGTEVWHQGYIPRSHVSLVWRNGVTWRHLSDVMYANTRWSMHLQHFGIYITTGKAGPDFVVQGVEYFSYIALNVGRLYNTALGMETTEEGHVTLAYTAFLEEYPKLVLQRELQAIVDNWPGLEPHDRPFELLRLRKVRVHIAHDHQQWDVATLVEIGELEFVRALWDQGCISAIPPSDEFESFAEVERLWYRDVLRQQKRFDEAPPQFHGKELHVDAPYRGFPGSVHFRDLLAFLCDRIDYRGECYWKVWKSDPDPEAPVLGQKQLKRIPPYVLCEDRLHVTKPAPWYNTDPWF
jgi:hypothetical protein